MKKEEINNHYEFYKQAKSFEDYAFRSFYFEKNVDRAIRLIELLNEKYKNNNMSNKVIELDNFGMFWAMNNTHIHWSSFSSFLDISAASYNKKVENFEWLKPINIANNIQEEVIDEQTNEFLNQCSLDNLLIIIRCMLLDICDEAKKLSEIEKKFYSKEFIENLSGNLQFILNKKRDFYLHFGSTFELVAKKIENVLLTQIDRII